MTRWIALVSLLAGSVFGQSVIPSKRVSTPVFTNLYNTNLTVESTLQWMGENWPTNIDPDKIYVEYPAFESNQTLMTTGYVSLAYAATNLMPGTNVSPGVYNPTTKTWTVQALGGTNMSDHVLINGIWFPTSTNSPEVLDYISLTDAGTTFHKYNSLEPLTFTNTDWTVAVEPVGYFSFSNGTTLYVPSNTIVIQFASYRTWMKTPEVASAEGWFTKPSGGAGMVAEISKEADDEDETVSKQIRWANGTVINRPTPSDRWFQTKMIVAGTNTTATYAIGYDWVRWDAILLGFRP